MSYRAQHQPFSSRICLCLHTNLLVCNANVKLCAVLCQECSLVCAVSPWLREKPKNAMILEAPWLLHAPKLLLWYVFASAESL